MNSEASLKPAIRKLIHSSQLKPEAVRVIVEGLEDENVTPEDWETLFNKEGAEIAIKQKIYSPQTVRLITLRAIVIPETLQEFLAWLNIQKSKKPDEHQTVSLEFQKDIRPLFPQEQLTKGINYLILNLLNKQISVDCVYWLLTTDGSAWFYARKKFITDVKYDLQLICAYGLLDNKFFKCRKQVWTTLINNWRGIQQGNHKSEEYQPLAELFERFKEYELAAYFYQVSQSNVANDLFYNIAYEKYLQLNPNEHKLSKILFYEVAYQEYRKSNISVYGLLIKRKPTLVEFIDYVLYFITLEVDMKIQFVIPLSLFILISGWFIGTKTWESHTSATDIEKSLCSKTFQDGKNCPVIVLEPETSYNFNEIKQLIPEVVEGVTKQKKQEEDNKYQKANEKYDKEMSRGKSATPPQEKTEENIRQEVIGKLGNILYPNNTALKYEDLSPGKEPTDLEIQKQWMTAIYNYQIKKNVTYQKIIADNGNKSDECNQRIFWVCLSKSVEDNDTSHSVDNAKDPDLYKRLKYDILRAMKSEQSRGINSPSQSLSRLKPTGNLKGGGENKKSLSTPKIPSQSSSRLKPTGNLKGGGENKKSLSTPKIPSQSLSRLKPTGNLKGGGENKKSLLTPKTPKNKSPNP
ncbi:hypothetical protein [Aphanizomenon flos-aquae]|uniref:hypothetical protein n=1 Tax=Aphanizomenon flos-aquae TaxID=1176 RepID=UPI0004BCE222|nr:hypothetical protein [Aphanizomenon flos-aquae]